MCTCMYRSLCTAFDAYLIGKAGRGAWARLLIDLPQRCLRGHHLGMRAQQPNELAALAPQGSVKQATEALVESAWVKGGHRQPWVIVRMLTRTFPGWVFRRLAKGMR